MEPSYINDGRPSFRNITFSKFQKSKARIELIKNLYDEKIENACYWSAEFICAGHFLDLWDIILYYSYKYIHNGNPKLSLYLNMRYNHFAAILNNGYNDNIIKMRNNDKIRRLFCELICVLCYSNKKNVICDVKLDKNNSFELSTMSEKFKAPNITYVDAILKQDDPKELIIPINELVYNLISKNIIQVCYWYEWLIENVVEKIECMHHKDTHMTQYGLYGTYYFITAIHQLQTKNTILTTIITTIIIIIN
jgi:hypothetical protein